MQAHAKVWLIYAIVGLSACAQGGSDQPQRKSGREPSNGGDGNLGDVSPYAGARNLGLAGRAGVGGAGAGSGGSAGYAGGNVAGATAGVGGMGAGGNAPMAGAGAHNSVTAGSANAGAGGATADCPSLTRVRLPTGMCVDRVTEFSIAKEPTSIVTGSDGQVWFDDDGANQLVQIDKEGRVLKKVDCDEGSSPRALVGGRDDALIWFTDARAKMLYRQSQTAHVGFNINFTATAIALGEGDLVWAAQAGQALLQVRPYVMTTPYAEFPSNALVVDPNGYLWFPTGSVIAEIVPDKGTQYFPIGQNLADDMCMGPDGALWFTDGRRHQIGRMDLNGKASAFDLPFGSGPTRIIMGPDGALWFIESGGDKIGRMTAKGQLLTQYPIPTSGSSPYALTLGGDRNIWFTERYSGKVARLLVDPG